MAKRYFDLLEKECSLLTTQAKDWKPAEEACWSMRLSLLWSLQVPNQKHNPKKKVSSFVDMQMWTTLRKYVLFLQAYVIVLCVLITSY